VARLNVQAYTDTFYGKKSNEFFPKVVVGTVGIILKTSHGLIIKPNIQIKKIFEETVPN
jgi:hypothetical protein